MSCKSACRCSIGVLAIGLICLIGWTAARGDDPPATSKPAAGVKDPFAVPDGKPPVLLGFINRMRKLQPPHTNTPEQKKEFLEKSHSAMVQAANKILETKPAAKLRLKALQAKVDALVWMKDNGDAGAGGQLGDLADQLKDDKQAEVISLVKPYIGMGKALAKGENAGEPRSWDQIKPKLAAAPNDKSLATEAIRAVENLERSGHSDQAVQAYRDLQGILSKSHDPQIAAQAKSFDGVIRRLTLPGRSMEIRGTLVDGAPLNTAPLRGKVVLVDFWATWCGPCRAEMPNVQANYAKYHSRGFEVVGVSLDSDKGALTKFLADQKIPWAILFQDARQGSGMAEYYGVTSIPTAILIDQKGVVVSLNAEGEELSRRLAELLGK